MNITQIEERAGLLTEVVEILPVSETQDLYGERGKLVYIRLSGSEKIPRAFKRTRALQKAVRTVGTINIAVDSVSDLFDLDRESMQRAFDVADVKNQRKVEEEQYFNRIIPDAIQERTDIGSVEVIQYEILVKVD
ncbi:MAG: hypothetical protein J07AB43_02580 [Candidatus Nanosalina sp. J07AB43]|jgi:hypothetical protein|nr:MAG: hypothetical protein J07AB43_02580 [Candidatus Nanosalina sp. J07AB43]